MLHDPEQKATPLPWWYDKNYPISRQWEGTAANTNVATTSWAASHQTSQIDCSLIVWTEGAYWECWWREYCQKISASITVHWQIGSWLPSSADRIVAWKGSWKYSSLWDINALPQSTAKTHTTATYRHGLSPKPDHTTQRRGINSTYRWIVPTVAYICCYIPTSLLLVVCHVFVTNNHAA